VVYNDLYLPPGVTLISNTTPVLGDIAGQLLEVNIAGTSTNITLGPLKNYVPQQIYFKAGTSLNIIVDLMCTIYNQTIKLSVNGNTQTYYGLLGNSSSTVVVYIPSGSPLNYYPQASFGYYGTITVKYPLIIVNKQEWAEGGVPAG
jgi:hypothetical protein